MSTETNTPSAQDAAWEGFTQRLQQVLSFAAIGQTDLARRLGVSIGFMSEIARGVKRPGTDFFIGLRDLLGISIDWLMTGQGSMTGGMGIRQELFEAISLQIAVVRAAVLQQDISARALMILIQEGQLTAAASDPAFAQLLEQLAVKPICPDDLRLAVELYNGHLWGADPIAQRRNILAAIQAYFEARKPIDKVAAVTGLQSHAAASKPESGGTVHKASTMTVQINTGTHQRNAGRDIIKGSKIRR
jgi:transcriptional regulator with XRE-family HTH domain